MFILEYSVNLSKISTCFIAEIIFPLSIGGYQSYLSHVLSCCPLFLNFLNELA